MNRVLTTAMAIGAGMAAFNLAQRNNMMSRRQMRKIQRKVSRALF